MSIELAWCAGFFDGEGSTTIYYRKNEKGWTTPTLRLSITQKTPNKEVLYKFQKVVGVGSVTTSYRSVDSKFMSGYYASNKDAQLIIALLSPFLGSEKKKQAEDAISIRIAYLNKKKEFYKCGHKKEGGRQCRICLNKNQNERYQKSKLLLLKTENAS